MKLDIDPEFLEKMRKYHIEEFKKRMDAYYRSTRRRAIAWGFVLLGWAITMICLVH